MAQYYIANADVQGWLGKLAAERDVFAPVREGDAVEGAVRRRRV